jgi:hypothetical protein
MFVPCVIGVDVVHHNVLVRRNRQPNVDLKSDAVAMLVTGSDHLHAATCNALVMVSSRSISLNMWARAASDDSEPSKVICGAICIFPHLAFECSLLANPSAAEWLRWTFDSVTFSIDVARLARRR